MGLQSRPSSRRWRARQGTDEGARERDTVDLDIPQGRIQARPAALKAAGAGQVDKTGGCMLSQQGITQVEQRRTGPCKAGKGVAAELLQFGTTHWGTSVWFRHHEDTLRGSLTQVGLPQIV